MNAATLPALIQRFFTDRLCTKWRPAAIRSQAIAIRSACSCGSRALDTASRQQSSPSKTSMPMWSPTPSFIARPRAGTPRVAATRGWPRFAVLPLRCDD